MTQQLAVAIKIAADAKGVAAAAEQAKAAVTAIGSTAATVSAQTGSAAAAAAGALANFGGAAGRAATHAASLGGQAARMNATLGLTGRQMQQLAPQINDVVTQLALGIPVWTIAIQQGGQMVQALGGVGATLALLKGPIGIALAAVTALGGAYVLLRGQTIDAAAAHESFAEAVRKSNELLETAAEKTARLNNERRLAALSDAQTAAAQFAATAAQTEQELKAAQRTLDFLKGKQAAQKSGPGGFTVLPADIDAASAKVEKLTRDLQAARAAMEAADAQYQRLLTAPAGADRETAAKKAEDERRRQRQREAQIAAEIMKEQEESDRAELERITRAIKARAEIERSYKQELADNASLIEALREGSLAYQEQATFIEIANRYRAAGQPLRGEEIAQARELARQLGAQRDEIDRLKRANEAAREAGGDFTRAISTELEDIAFEGKKAIDVVDALGRSMARIALRVLITKPFETAFGSLIGSIDFGSLFGGGTPAPSAPQFSGLGGLYHGGGIVGSTPVAQRFIRSEIIAAAPRLHSGALLPGEQPAVLMRGEGVFTPRQMENADRLIAAALQSGPIVQIVDNRGANAPPVEIQRSRGPDGREIIRAIINEAAKDVRSAGVLGQAISQSFGVAYAARGR